MWLKLTSHYVIFFSIYKKLRFWAIQHDQYRPQKITDWLPVRSIGGASCLWQHVLFKVSMYDSAGAKHQGHEKRKFTADLPQCKFITGALTSLTQHCCIQGNWTKTRTCTVRQCYRVTLSFGKSTVSVTLGPMQLLKGCFVTRMVLFPKRIGRPQTAEQQLWGTALHCTLAFGIMDLYPFIVYTYINTLDCCHQECDYIIIVKLGL